LPDLENHLKAIIGQTDTILFIGSGISRWSGLPSWGGLILELADFLESHGIDASIVRRESDSGELLQAASYAFDRLTKSQICEFVRKSCRVGNAHPHPVHEKIVTLGPTCFVTTNYDHLIEDSLREWKRGQHFRVVTNRQLVETAEIIQSRSMEFVFKLHGDVDDCDSIVLTHEQYRALLPDGELHHALETAHILLASRPIVYLGFGLRDPDFNYIRNLLANTYKGATRDHYAVMADVAAVEADYWRRHYGIQILSYPTAQGAEGSRGHTGLLQLLERLRPQPALDSALRQVPSDDDRLTLGLMRHASRLSRFEPQGTEFPLRVNFQKARTGGTRFTELDLFHGSKVERLLDKGPRRLVLVGHPGAGKSYALRKAVSRIADQLHKHCMTEPFPEKEVSVPVFLDLKLYRGNLRSLVETSLPVGLSLDSISSRFKMRLFLDAFNEMPSDYLEQGSWEADFSSVLTPMNPASLVISSRTTDLLTNLDLPVFALDQLDADYVKERLAHRKMTVSGKLRGDVLQLLQTPLYFKLVMSGGVVLPTDAHPRDLYAAVLAKLSVDFVEKFRANVELEPAFRLTAYSAMDKGQEAVATSEFLALLQDQLLRHAVKADAKEILNWLVGRDFLVPYSGGRVAFFHQSVTEFLAAEELACRYLDSPSILTEKLGWRRWDQALFLAMSFLPQRNAAKFVDEVARIDLGLALSAARFAGVASDKITQRLLRKIYERPSLAKDFSSSLPWILVFVPLSPEHQRALRKIVRLGNSLGGVAAARLTELFGRKSHSEVFGLLSSRSSDYNFCRPIGEALNGKIVIGDLPRIVRIIDKVQSLVKGKGGRAHQGLDSAVGVMISKLPIRRVYEALYDRSKPYSKQKVRLAVLYVALREQRSSESLAVAGELFLEGWNQAVVCLSFIAKFGKERNNLNWSSFDTRHLDKCIKLLSNEEHAQWSLSFLRAMSMARQDFRSLLQKAAENEKGIKKACLLFACTDERDVSIFDALSETTRMSPDEIQAEPVGGLKGLEVDWTGHEDLFVQLLRLRNVRLACPLIECIYSRNRGNVKVEIGRIDWWLDWLRDGANTKEYKWWFHDRLSFFLTTCVDAAKRAEYVYEFNKKDSRYRDLIAATVLGRIDDLTTDQLTSNAVSYLLKNLSQKHVAGIYEPLLGQIATEGFVLSTLLPLLQKARGRKKKNLLAILRRAGRRHGRRYLAE
jgi:SIR2-like domain